MKAKLLENICNVVSNLEFGVLPDLIRKALKSGIKPYAVITDGISKGMNIVGSKFSNHEYFLSELLAAGVIVQEGMEVLKPHLEKGDVKSRGTVVLGTVAGDVHNIGKDIVNMLFTSAGFTVYDLGVDVQPEEFCDKVDEVKADIVAMSALLTITMPAMADVIMALKQRGLRETVKIIIGGSPVTTEFGRTIGADYVAIDATEGVRVCTKWMEGR